MYRVCLALLLLLSLRPLPVAAGPAVGEAGRWNAVAEDTRHAVLGSDAAELRVWMNEALPDGSAPPAALPPPAPLLARAHPAILPSAPAPAATSPCGPQSLSYYATAPPRTA